MRKKNQLTCPECNGTSKHYDIVKRVVRSEKRKTRRVKIRRLKCVNCGHIHRETPNYLLPYKQYRKDIIYGVVRGYIDSETFGYEDYPCEITMKRWTNNIEILSR